MSKLSDESFRNRRLRENALRTLVRRCPDKFGGRSSRLQTRLSYANLILKVVERFDATSQWAYVCFQSNRTRLCARLRSTACISGFDSTRASDWLLAIRPIRCCIQHKRLDLEGMRLQPYGAREQSASTFQRSIPLPVISFLKYSLDLELLHTALSSRILYELSPQEFKRTEIASIVCSALSRI